MFDKNKRIKKYLGEILVIPPEQLKPNTTLESLDSLDRLELKLECEEILETEIVGDDIENVETIGEIFEILNKINPDIKLNEH